MIRRMKPDKTDYVSVRYFVSLFVIKLDLIEIVVQSDGPEHDHEEKENAKKSNLECCNS